MVKIEVFNKWPPNYNLNIEVLGRGISFNLSANSHYGCDDDGNPCVMTWHIFVYRKWFPMFNFSFYDYFSIQISLFSRH